MGLYSRYIFPHLMDAALSGPQFQKLRSSLLATLKGEVFEIGFGTGLNLPHYPDAVKRITTVDPNPGSRKLAERRIANSRIEVVHRTTSGETLPFESDSFHTIVCTFTLCSIGNVDRALLEMLRILKPGGHFHFLEHGLSDDPRVQWWQHQLTPLQRRIGDGCHLDRDTCAMIQHSGFNIEQLDHFYLEQVPRFGGYIHRGIAGKR